MTESDPSTVLARLDSEHGEELIVAAADLDPLSARAALSGRFGHADPELLRAAIEQADLRRSAGARFGETASLLWTRDGLEQADLRRGAGARFGETASLLWTRDGLEQASRPAVSRYRAGVMRDLGFTTAVDLTCGVGLDLLAMAAAGLRVIGVERDPLTASIARRNAARLGLADVRVLEGDCTNTTLLDTLPAEAAWFVDPARRDQVRRLSGAHRRLTDPQQWSPPWSWVRELGQRAGRSSGPALLVAKASPALDEFDSAAVEWLSVDGDLVEASAWWGKGTPGSRCAVMLDEAGGCRARICSHIAEVPVRGLPQVDQWLLEPDAAVIRAGAVADLGAHLGADLVDQHLAYLSRSAATDDPAVARQWRVLYAGRYDRRALAQLCRAHHITRVDVTGRGRRFDPAQVKRDLRLPGGSGRAATLHTLALGKERRTAVILGFSRSQSAS